MDAFREPTPHEIQQAVLQFMGQNMGELKHLDSSLISKNNTLQGMTLQPGQVMRSVPQGPRPAPPQQPVQHILPQNHYVYQQVNTPVQPQPQPQAVETVSVNDPMQLEFNFEKSQYGKSILESLKEIETLLKQQCDTLQLIQKGIVNRVDNVDQADDKKKEE